MIRLVASDVDGTLVPDGTTNINPEVFEVISKLHDRGIMVAIASGRHWRSIEYLFETIKEKVFYISDNGAYVGTWNRSLYCNSIEDCLAKEYIQALRENDAFDIILSTEDAYYTDTHNEYLIEWLHNGYHAKVNIVDDLLKVDKKIIKISAYCNDDITKYGNRYMDEYKDRLSIKYAGTMWLDGNAIGVGKGNAIKELQEALDISDKETMVFGDQDNDTSMMDNAYYSFAVSNAVDSAKKSSRFRAEANTDDGVIKILKLLL